ncbi:(R)-citramalate synthase [Georgfuchsia toluolica]|uniref:Citramalate synthase n=1 Tax=Georgfuchsia toluolica TaxID=424218 RepID=A0A916J5N0_9PROT|nr:citramalate synthase [Georgfuchsia toluolica]CAG4884402.1 (R)-citramalate synthase [Georgfuchsia toluolica]
MTVITHTSEVQNVTKIDIYDSTLRDGAQAQGVSYSVEDKIKIVQRLDELGIRYIEAGNPGSNPKDLEFFARLGELRLRHAKIIAFGSTFKVGGDAATDANVQSLLRAGASAVAIFGKSWDFQVTDILRTTQAENLRMIGDTIRHLRQGGLEVVFDAEHFFDGYKANPGYALQTLAAAAEAGAGCLCLCDTNGGSFPDEIFDIVKVVCSRFKCAIGIHCHNDGEMAVANSVAAVRAGATQVQGTLNGIGERCGNANLCAIIPNLQLKLGFECIPPQCMKHLTSIARFASEIANLAPNDKAPYVGSHAFAHKGGMHIDAVNKTPTAYEHINPELVGNHRTILMSEVAGRSTLLALINAIDPGIKRNSPQTQHIMDRLKQLEHEGYQFETAESSFELIVRKELGKYQPFFELKEFKVIVDEPSASGVNSSAMIKIRVGDTEEITAAEGDGPVNALDQAIRKALERFYPAIREVKLTDYKVRVLDSDRATAAKVRVLIESTDHTESWTTIGVSTDVINASWLALVDAIEYKLVREQERQTAPR